MRSRLFGVRFGVVLVVLFAASCSGTVESSTQNDFVLIGSTACDAAIKTAVGIPAETKCDFIRWNLAFNAGNANTFKLDLNYGEGQPNTLGFIDGGHKISASGKFEINPQSSTSRIPNETSGPRSAETLPKQSLAPRREIYLLKSERPAIDVSLLKLNANLFQLLLPDGAMMVGNAGWSYTLNRSTPLADATVPNMMSSVADNSASAATTVFEGRTPCRELATFLGSAIDPDCFKLKWRLTLQRDRTTLEPTTFAIESTLSRFAPVRGRWSIAKPAGTSRIIYNLEPEPPAKPLSLLLAEDSILFFLDARGHPLVGNKDFSFTLNRRQ